MVLWAAPSARPILRCLLADQLWAACVGVNRFWHKVLYDLGVVSTKEPFQSLVSQGMILGEVRLQLQCLHRCCMSCDRFADRKLQGPVCSCCSSHKDDHWVLCPARMNKYSNAAFKTWVLKAPVVHAQVEYSVSRDKSGNAVSDDHPEASPSKCVLALQHILFWQCSGSGKDWTIFAVTAYSLDTPAAELQLLHVI